MLGKQASDLCTSTLTQYFVREYFREGQLARVHREPGRDLPRAPRRDARGAATRYFPPQATWTEPEGGLFIWATLPPYIDTSDLLAKALRENVAFVPGQAAYVDGRGRNSMRLNFSAGDDGRDPRGHPPHRQGDRRAGRALRRPDRRDSRRLAPRAKARGDGEAENVLPFRKAGEGSG